jgi:hypothetical protein
VSRYIDYFLSFLVFLFFSLESLSIAANKLASMLSLTLAVTLTTPSPGAQQERQALSPGLQAQRLLNASGVDHRLEHGWIQRFLTRNPDVKSIRSTVFDYYCVNGATLLNNNIFFDRLEAPEAAAIPSDRWYNSDEIGLAQGVSGAHRVISDAH